MKIGFDRPPREGRAGSLAVSAGERRGRELQWGTGDFSLWSEAAAREKGRRSLDLAGSLRRDSGLTPASGWIELETDANGPPEVVELFLVGTRPLPGSGITTVSRHPTRPDLLVLGTSDSRLLLVGAALTANLKIHAEITLPSTPLSIAPGGGLLLVLVRGEILLYQAGQSIGDTLAFSPRGSIRLPVDFAALAENDHTSCWGLSPSGSIYRVKIPDYSALSSSPPLSQGTSTLEPAGRLHGRNFSLPALVDRVRLLFQQRPVGRLPRLRPRPRAFNGLAFDGMYFWAHRGHSDQLLQYDLKGRMLRSFPVYSRAYIASIGYRHNHLMLLDPELQQLHLLHIVDNLRPTACLSPSPPRHPGYLEAGGPASGGIHDLCLIYLGAEGKESVSRYNKDSLRPLVGYLGPDRQVKDFFMDGFLLVAQYSPLLNGRPFGVDLPGNPSRREDWEALFDEYFHPTANLAGLEECAAETSRSLGVRTAPPVKVVLTIPTPDPRCTDWDGHGRSLKDASDRIAVNSWAMDELLSRWKKAGYRRLQLAGFYYMTEQGAWNDPVTQSFSRRCRELRMRSFAIPGITSSWMTEFNRAGFDCVALQPSHAFNQPPLRPPLHFLKSAGRIARGFGMGVEVELPYDVADSPASRRKVYDYLEMARIQGWAGAFKAYFQSYRLLQILAESGVPEARQLYDDLYHLSREARHGKALPRLTPPLSVPLECGAKWQVGEGKGFFKLNLEGHQGGLVIRKIQVRSEGEA